MIDDDLEMVRLAAQTQRPAGAVDAEALARFELSPARFWQRVLLLVHDPDVQVALPVETGRLQRLLAARRCQRRAS
jgi:hypothetical protein